MTSQDEAVKLEPCPFCGSDKVSVRNVEPEFYICGCDNCNADGGYPSVGDSWSPAEAIAAWNRRALVPSPPAGEAVHEEEPEPSVRRRYWDDIEALVKLVTPTALSPENLAKFEAIKEEHSWDGLSCYCGGGWLVGHRSGCPEAVPAKASAEDSGVMDALDELQQAEAEYRLMHDRHGDGGQATGRAWDRLRLCGDKARAILNSLPSTERELSE